jgi:prephenate dehydrogenase
MHVSIIGLGLIGGSLGLALKKTGWQKAEITGYVRSSEIGEFALSIGAVDRITLSLEKAVSRSDLIIIATPVLTIKDILIEIAPYLPSNCVVTDTASTKQQVMSWAEDILPSGISFIGGHPMAGKDTSGIRSAEADMFVNSTYCLVSGSKTTSNAEQILTDMIASIGANTIIIDALEHDNLVAGISHLPFIISAALVSATTGHADWARMSQLTTSGYRDTTRLASGNPDVNAQICLTNQAAIVNWIDVFNKELERLKVLIGNNDSEIINSFSLASKTRKKWQEKHPQ